MKIEKHKGYFGEFGGRFAPETLMPVLDEVEKAYAALKKDKKFRAEYDGLLHTYCGRPTPLYFARGLTKSLAARGFT